MFLLLDNVRDNIENKMGREVYLSGFPFFSLQKKINYERSVPPDVLTADYLHGVKSSALTYFQQPDPWNSEDEILSWKASTLRDLVRFFYREWDEIMTLDLFKPASFDDGIDCVLLESVCTRSDMDPTLFYHELNEIKFMFLWVKATTNSLVISAHAFQTMRERLSDAPGNEFVLKRLAGEFERLKINEYKNMASDALEKIRQIHSILRPSERALFEKMDAILSRVIHCFEVYVDSRYMKNHLSTLQDWINALLTFSDSPKPNPSLLFKCNESHYDIIGKISIVTKLLYTETVCNEEVFAKRNQILFEFIPEAFDEEIEKLLLERTPGVNRI